MHFDPDFVFTLGVVSILAFSIFVGESVIARFD